MGSAAAAFFRCASEGWWALVDDLRTLPLVQIAAGIPPMDSSRYSDCVALNADSRKASMLGRDC